FVAGLGNPRITPDAIGTEVVRKIMVTRHLRDNMPEQFGGLRSVSAFSAGVLGTTGIETAEIIRAIVDKTAPDLIIAVDSLASRRASRLCCTVQLADTGIIPGSGIGNRRAAINRETMGADVLAIGVPTVVDAATLAADLIEETGGTAAIKEDPADNPGMMVTPRDIDARIENMSKMIALSLNMLLQPDLSDEELAFLLD
ncbi:MAG: GPR endopeptidase, partial [Oscillospiraceae bacterium]|nr:GPR endopeptidase [Oscillospiraceae bacterium]